MSSNSKEISTRESLNVRKRLGTRIRKPGEKLRTRKVMRAEREGGGGGEVKGLYACASKSAAFGRRVAKQTAERKMKDERMKGGGQDPPPLPPSVLPASLSLNRGMALCAALAPRKKA